MAKRPATDKPSTGKRRKRSPYPFTPMAHIVFCDDVRHERSGKAIYIGVYQGIMLVQQFPLELPTFCVLASIAVPEPEKVETLSLSLRYNGREMSQLNSDSNDIDAVKANRRLPYDPAELRKWAKEIDPSSPKPINSDNFNFIMNATPFILEEEGVLRLIVELNGRRLRTPALYVRKAPGT